MSKVPKIYLQAVVIVMVIEFIIITIKFIVVVIIIATFVIIIRFITITVFEVRNYYFIRHFINLLLIRVIRGLGVID
jgi:hypothetical protein